MKYILDVDAWKMEIKVGTYYGNNDFEQVDVTKAELYEAITKYLQVKGFTATKVSVSDEPVLKEAKGKS